MIYINRRPNSKYIPIESVIDVNDPNVWWFYIPGFNGYEISNTGLVRSMKHFKKYPYGILIKTRNKIREQDPSFELSDNNNERVIIRLSQLQHLARSNPYSVHGYPRHTICTDIAPRNMRAFIKKQIKVQPLDNTTRFPKFTIIDEEDQCKTRMMDDIVVPILSIDGSEYYGRNDIKTIFT